MGMMVRKQIGVGGAFVSVLAATVMTVSACSSGGGSAEPAPSSSANIQSVSVAPGVEKDSVLDLNSTKDMTGVVTTVPIGKSPYDKNMPDVCRFIDQPALERLGLVTKTKAFTGSPLVTQSCQLRAGLDNQVTVSARIYVNNIKEHLSAPNLRAKPGTIPVFANVRGYVLTDVNLNGADGFTGCEVAWGTFYGTAAVGIIDQTGSGDTCGRVIDDARVLAPLFPRSPSQMRPTS